MAEESGLRVEREDGIVTVVFDRPEKKNALTLEMFDALREAVESVAADSGARRRNRSDTVSSPATVPTTVPASSPCSRRQRQRRPRGRRPPFHRGPTRSSRACCRR